MSKAQFLTTPGGEELVVLPRAEFERLTALASAAEEDEADIAEQYVMFLRVPWHESYC